jgi:uncharacterized protein
VICDSNLIVSWRVPRRGFVALMGLYESNYLRFAQLVGDLGALRDRMISRVPGDCELVLEMRARAPYTSELDLTYLLPEPSTATTGPAPLTRLPDLRLRLYHDAHLLEAHERGQTRAAERELQQCWRRNMMLNKWLEYCTERGHRFAGAAAG